MRGFAHALMTALRSVGVRVCVRDRERERKSMCVRERELEMMCVCGRATLCGANAREYAYV